MSQLSITWADIEGLGRFDNMLGALGVDMPKVAVRAINHTGDRTKTQVIRALTKQTGLKRATVVKAIGEPKKASWGSLSYVMMTRGGDISLRYFAARETRRGVSAKPFGKRQVFPSTFMKGGRFPNRVPLSMGGHVFERNGSGRLPIARVPSGVVLPTEMVQGATADAFNETVRTRLPDRLEHEINRATGGAFR